MADEIIKDFLYLGDKDDAFCREEYSRIIDVRRWIEPDEENGYVDSDTLDALALLLNKSHALGEKVLVHCSAGMERSPLVVVWYLYKYQSYTFPALGSAYKYVQKIRPCVQNRECWIRYKRRK